MPQSRGRFANPLLVVIYVLAFSTLFATAVYGQIGGPLPGMKAQESKFFTNGKAQFIRVWGMQEGVGPVLTDGGCARCHSQAIANVQIAGGSSTRLLTFFGKVDQSGVFDGLDGKGPSGENEGGLLLQTRSNNAFLANCSQGGEVLPADANAVENRLAPAVFGFGLIDAIDDLAITDQAAFELNNYTADGIHGTANAVGTQPNYPNGPNLIGRFGRKAQIANLVEMTAFAFAHDLGITNLIFPDEDLPQGQPIDPACSLNNNVPNNSNPGSGNKGMFPLSHFMRYLAPATVAACPNGATDCAQGQTVFTTVGCDKCHKQSYTTKGSYRVQTDMSGTSLPSPALSSQAVNLYSDLLLHDMGNVDKGAISAGFVNTGTATPSQWRTTPLWGLQYRINFNKFMHNGGVTSLDAAIRAHSDGVTGEAVSVINNYKALSSTDQKALIDFLSTL